MFPYTDPAGKVLTPLKALKNYRQLLQAEYLREAQRAGSAFTLLEAFEQIAAGKQPETPTVTWLAFPKTSPGTPEQIDRDRQRQDEYVEWRTERNTAGKVARVTFTTEFTEYYQALAQVSMAALVAGIQQVIPNANPKASELFGPNFNPDAASANARALQLRIFAPRNPWTNGQKGILFLIQQSNTMGALFLLVGECGIAKPSVLPTAVCGTLGGACVPGRSSDPVICQACQGLAQNKNAFSLQDPVGVRILRLNGIWKINGQQIDVNDPDSNRGAFKITRNGRRAEVKVVKGLTIGDDEITTGTQVSTLLEVGATVITAAEADLPVWARVGQEASPALAGQAGAIS